MSLLSNLLNTAWVTKEIVLEL